MDKLKTMSARSSFYGAASYVERDVRSDLNARTGLTYGYYGRISYPGDWRIDFDKHELHFAFRGSFNRREVKMPGAYAEYYNDVNMDVAVVPLTEAGDLKPQLEAKGIKITPHIDSIIEKAQGFHAGEIEAQDLSFTREERIERVAARKEKAIHDATNLQQPLTVKGPLQLKH